MPPTPHPFIPGERYEDRRGEYTVLKIAGDVMTIQYADGSQRDDNVQIKSRTYRNILIEQRAQHPLLSDGYFFTVGFLAIKSEFNAEVPPQSQQGFEERYFLSAGTRPALHRDGYFPIQIETTWDKWGSELRIYCPANHPPLELPPDVELRDTPDPGLVRINNNALWWKLVNIGFRLGKGHRIDEIRATVPRQFQTSFERGVAS